MLTNDEARAEVYARQGEAAFVAHENQRYAYMNGGERATNEVAVRETGLVPTNEAPVHALPAATPGKSLAVRTNMPSAFSPNLPARRRNEVAIPDRSPVRRTDDTEHVDWEIVDDKPTVGSAESLPTVGSAESLPVFEGEVVEDDKKPGTALELYEPATAPSKELAIPDKKESDPSGIDDPLYRARHFTGTKSRKPADAPDVPAAPAPEAAPLSAGDKRAAERLKVAEDAAAAALERWTLLSADRSGRIITSNKKVKQAYEEYLKLQETVVTQKVQNSIRTMRRAGIDTDSIDFNDITHSVRVNASLAAAQRRTDLRREMSQRYLEDHPRRAKFIQWWANQGGKTAEGKTNWKGKLKKAGVVALVAVPTGLVVGGLISTGLGAGLAAVGGAAVTEGLARGVAGSSFDGRAASLDNRILDAQHNVDIRGIYEKAGWNYNDGDGRTINTGVTLRELTNPMNTHTDKEVSRSRRRVVTATAIGATLGLVSGVAADTVGDWLQGDASAEPLKTTEVPPVEEPVVPPAAPKPPEFDPVTMRVEDGYGIQHVMRDYAEQMGTELDGDELHQTFLEGQREDLFDTANVDDSMSGSKPMSNIGGGVGFPTPDVNTTLSADTVEFLNKELSADAVEEYIKDHNIEGNITDKQIEDLIDGAYDKGVIAPDAILTQAQIEQFLSEELTKASK